MDLLALFAGNALVWMAGCAVIAWMRPAPAEGASAWTLGCGWFVGIVLLTAWMRVLSVAGVALGVWAVGTPLLVIVVGGVALAVRHGAFRPRAARVLRGLLQQDLVGWRRTLWLVLLAWLVLRFGLLLGEVVERPLYPWDAWTQWGTKAKVWYELRDMVPFLPRDVWLASGATGFTDAGPHYPATVPLVQVWSALLVGRWDDVLVNLPWWIAGVAFVLAIFGYLRGAGFGPLGALTVTWLVASLPMLNVHVALAGYADLWMAAFLTLGVLAGMRWLQWRARMDAVVAIVLLAACITIKNPGIVWLVVLVPGVLVALLPRVGTKVAFGCLGVVALLLVAFARFNTSFLGYTLKLEFVSPWQGLWDAWFVYANWHLLWLAAIAVALLGRRQLLAPGIAPLTLVVVSGLLFLLFGFAFTNAARWVADQSTVNRATLHLAPIVMVWTALLWKAWLQAASPGRALDAAWVQAKTG